MNTASADVTETTSIIGVARVIRRHLLIFALFSLVVPAIAYLYSSKAPAVYEAQTQVLVQQQDPSNAIAGTAGAVLTPEDPVRFANTNAAIARSNVVATQTARTSKVPGLTAAGVLDQTTVDPAATADVLDITAKTSDGGVSVAIANAYAAAFVAERTRLDVSAISKARTEAGNRLQALEAEGDTTSALVKNLQDKEQQLTTMQTLYTSRASVLVTAAQATDVRPEPTQRMAIGLVIGMLLGLVAAFARETFDPRVRSSRETGRSLGAPVLGRIPVMSRRLAQAGGVVLLDDPTSEHAEAVRFLRSNIENLRSNNIPLSLLVTGPQPGVGKSTIAADLAVALAQSGHQVALLDGDPRHPSAARLFRTDDLTGVAEVARGTAALHEALVSVDVGLPDDALGGLRILTGRPRATLESERLVFGRAIAELREECDFVLVDGPPLLSGGDALSLSAVVDGLVLVCRMDRLRRATVDELENVLPHVPTTVLGVVCNAVSGRDANAYPSYQADPAGRKRRLGRRAAVGRSSVR